MKSPFRISHPQHCFSKNPWEELHACLCNISTTMTIENTVKPGEAAVRQHGHCACSIFHIGSPALQTCTVESDRDSGGMQCRYEIGFLHNGFNDLWAGFASKAALSGRLHWAPHLNLYSASARAKLLLQAQLQHLQHGEWTIDVNPGRQCCRFGKGTPIFLSVAAELGGIQNLVSETSVAKLLLPRTDCAPFWYINRQVLPSAD
mmetsp:Transcript_17937/g.41834  ORF Transcript_17937/g.41834 Transcript_17937/m.41834 type:complete len:204 (-) Transcript_17937:70-681(-)